jgi:hypothetical protein
MRWLKHWFWAPIKAEENWAQTLVRVCGNLFRISLTLFVVGAGFISAAAIYSSTQSAVTSAVRDSEIAAIRVRVVLTTGQDSTLCTEGHPLVVAVANNTDKAIMSMTVDLVARNPGSSSNQLGYLNREIELDAIIPPGYQYYECWSMPAKYQGMTFDGAVEPYSLRLQAAEDWMISETKARKISSTQ